MANKILVDTSVLIGLQLGDEKVISQFGKIQDRVVISRITACEFIYGSRNKQEKQIIKDFLEQIEIVEVDQQISKHAYFLLNNHGLNVDMGIADVLIAATAIIHGYKLWTFNTKYFKVIKELKMFREKFEGVYAE